MISGYTKYPLLCNKFENFKNYVMIVIKYDLRLHKTSPIMSTKLKISPIMSVDLNLMMWDVPGSVLL